MIENNDKNHNDMQICICSNSVYWCILDYIIWNAPRVILEEKKIGRARKGVGWEK